MGVNELQHHGILGMRWGVRRDRGPDGRVVRSTVSEMSTRDLQELVNRMNLEKQYIQLTTKEISKGRKIVNELLLSIGKEAAKEIAKSYTKPLIESIKRKG